MGMWLAGLPTLTLWALAGGVSAGLALLGLRVFRRAIPHQTLKPYNDVIGFVHGIIGVVYAVMLAFTIVVSWEQFETSQRNVQQEASIVADLLNDNKLLMTSFRDGRGPAVSEPSPVGDTLNTMQAALADYVKAVTEDEWDSMAEGRDSAWAQLSYRQIWSAYGTYAQSATVTPLQATFFGEILGKLNELGERRRARLDDAGKSLPQRFWTVLLAGGILIVAFSLFYGVEHRRVHAVLVASVAVLIGISLSLIVSLEHPFRGETGVSKEPFANLQKIDAWGPR